MALTLFLVAAYGGVAWVSLARFHDRVLRDAAVTLDGTGHSVEIATNRSLVAASALLFGAAQAIIAAPAPVPGDPATGALLRSLHLQSLPLRNVLLLDRRGRLVSAAEPPPQAAPDFAASPFFAAHLARNAAPLFVGLNAGDQAAGRSLILSRPLYRDGRFDGVIAAEMPIATFAEILQTAVRGTADEASLLLARGALVAALPPRPDRIGQVPEFARSFLKVLADPRAHSVLAASKGEGQWKLRELRKLADFPLIVAVSCGRARVLQRWSDARLRLLAGFGVFAATAIVLSWLIIGTLNRGERATLDLRRSEARSKRQNALLQSTLESMTEGLSVFNRQGRLVAWNRRFCELLDLPKLVLGMRLGDILMRQAMRGDFGEVVPAVEVARRVEEFYRDVPQIKDRVTAAGRVLQIRRSAMPDGAVLSMYSDITDLRNSERKLIEARRQAELANHAKSEFLANMSHELRTPLNAVIGFSEVISNQIFGPLRNPKYLEYLKDIHSSSLHLLSIINDVLDMSKIEAGKLDLLRQKLRLQSIAAASLRLLRERASSRKLTIIPEFAAEDIVIEGDERAMKQVFLNLLANAIKFSHEGGTIRLRVAREGRASAVIEIEDQGIGMTPEEQQRALEPFGQAQAATTRHYGGTGLGLPITKGLIEAHGGQLTLESRPGAGTTVRLVLPTAETWPAASSYRSEGAAAE